MLSTVFHSLCKVITDDNGGIIMDIFGVLKLIGGLVLFLYGMNIMGDGLEKLSGGRLENMLEKMTSTKVKQK